MVTKSEILKCILLTSVLSFAPSLAFTFLSSQVDRLSVFVGQWRAGRVLNHWVQVMLSRRAFLFDRMCLLVSRLRAQNVLHHWAQVMLSRRALQVDRMSLLVDRWRVEKGLNHWIQVILSRKILADTVRTVAANQTKLLAKRELRVWLVCVAEERIVSKNPYLKADEYDYKGTSVQPRNAVSEEVTPPDVRMFQPFTTSPLVKTVRQALMEPWAAALYDTEGPSTVEDGVKERGIVDRASWAVSGKGTGKNCEMWTTACAVRTHATLEDQALIITRFFVMWRRLSILFNDCGPFSRTISICHRGILPVSLTLPASSSYTILYPLNMPPMQLLTRNLVVAALLLICEGRRLITANMLLVWCAQEDVEAGTLKLILRLDLHSEVCARRPTYTAASPL